MTDEERLADAAARIMADDHEAGARDLRAHALHIALKYSTTGSRDADKVVASAELFERYLSGAAVH